MLLIEPLISIIIPIYNVEKYLAECIESVINQSYRKLEIILVNDGSTDSSSAICKGFQKQDSRILVIDKENGGLASARNAGLEIAKGELIGFVDSDDWIDGNMYENLLKEMDKYDADVSVCRYSREYRNRVEKKIFPQEYIIYEGSERVAYGYFIDKSLSPIVMNKLFKRKVFDDGFAFPVGRNYEDLLLSAVLIKQNARVVFVGKEYYHYRQRYNSIIHSKNKKNGRDNWISRRERYSLLKFLPEYIKRELMKECITAIYKYLQVCDYDRGHFEIDEVMFEMIRFVKENSQEIRKYKFPLDIRIMVAIVSAQKAYVFNWAKKMSKIHKIISAEKDKIYEYY